MYVPFSVSICDGREDEVPTEELDETEGLLGVWGGEVDTLQGESIVSHGPLAFPVYTNHHYSNFISGLGSRLCTYAPR